MKWYKFRWWYIKGKILVYFWYSMTVPARVYCLIRGYDYKKWIWERIEEDNKE